MKVSVKAFASAREAVGFAEGGLEVPARATVMDVIDMLSVKNAELSAIRDTLLFAVNEEYCEGERILQDEDVLAIFPPVSGG